MTSHYKPAMITLRMSPKMRDKLNDLAVQFRHEYGKSDHVSTNAFIMDILMKEIERLCPVEPIEPKMTSLEDSYANNLKNQESLREKHK